ncbi:MAG: hypothetical protein ACUVTO_06870 [Candidatus Caldatribacteriaceae bacterium]
MFVNEADTRAELVELELKTAGWAEKWGIKSTAVIPQKTTSVC